MKSSELLIIWVLSAAVCIRVFKHWNKNCKQIRRPGRK